VREAGCGILECEGLKVGGAKVWVWEYGVLRCWGDGVWVFAGRGSRGVVGKVWESGSGYSTRGREKNLNMTFFGKI
jgi:hypothetical protein